MQAYLPLIVVGVLCAAGPLAGVYLGAWIYYRGSCQRPPTLPRPQARPKPATKSDDGERDEPEFDLPDFRA
jgi:hypothetical protein